MLADQRLNILLALAQIIGIKLKEGNTSCYEYCTTYSTQKARDTNNTNIRKYE